MKLGKDGCTCETIGMKIHVRSPHLNFIWETLSVADPGFPEEGRRPRRGASTPEAVTF